MGLVKITYELLLESLSSANAEIDTDNESAGRHIIHAQKILRTLMSGLNMEIDLSSELLDIYMYISSILIDCQIKSHRDSQKDVVKENIAHVTELLNSLLDGINAVPDTDKPALDMSQKIFAGMTYGKDGNMTELITEDSAKVYKA